MNRPEKPMRKQGAGNRGWLAALPLVAAIAGCSDCDCVAPPPVIPDTAAPRVASTDPDCAATGVAVDDAFTITFDEAMATGTLNDTTIALTDAAGADVPGAVAPTATTATFTPTNALAAGTTFRLTVGTAVTDTSGNALAAPFGCRFTTATTDSTAPLVESSTPVCGAADVDRNADLAVVFNEALDPTTVSGTTVFLRNGGTDIAGTPSLSGRTILFDPAATLAADADLELTITVGVRDADGNRTPLAANFTCAFTTDAADPGTDTTPPAVSQAAAEPACNSAGASLNTSIFVPFAEAMDPASLETAITLLDEDGAEVDGEVDAAGARARFVPDADLAPSTVYTLRVGTAALDLAGNALAAQSSCAFTTGTLADTTRPRIASTVPADAASLACAGAVTATFDERMDPMSITQNSFTLESAGVPVAGTVSYDAGTRTASFTPAAALAAGTFTAEVTTGARDLSGNALDAAGGADNPWTFTCN